MVLIAAASPAYADKLTSTAGAPVRETARPAKPAKAIKATKIEKAKPKAAKLEVAPVDEEPLVPGVLDPTRILSLTNDPVFGKADRIDGDEVKGLVTFTFDDGPHPDTTPAVIDALEKYNVPATFFIVTSKISGKANEKSRAILARQLAAGFEIGSHSVTHPNLKRAKKPKLELEIDNSLKTLAPQAARPIGLFRPPFGAFNGIGKAHLQKLGLTDVRWSVDTLDWKAKDADLLRKKTVSMILKQNGGVVLMHDVKPITAGVIAQVLDDLEAENCRRLADKQEPIVPVSLHYWVKDGKTPRAVPDAVKKRTAAYRAALPTRCAARAPAPAPTPTPAAVTAPKAK